MSAICSVLSPPRVSRPRDALGLWVSYLDYSFEAIKKGENFSPFFMPIRSHPSFHNLKRREEILGLGSFEQLAVGRCETDLIDSWVVKDEFEAPVGGRITLGDGRKVRCSCLATLAHEFVFSC